MAYSPFQAADEFCRRILLDRSSRRESVRYFPKFQSSGDPSMRSKIGIPAVLSLCIVLLCGALAGAQAPGPVPLSNPNGLAFDSSGNLFVANAGSNQILEYSPSLQQIDFISSGLSKPNRLVFDGEGNLYVSNAGNNSVTVYAPQNRHMPFRIITTGLDFPLGIDADLYGDVYVSNNRSNNIKVYDVRGSLIETLTGDKNGRSFSAPGTLAIYGRNIYVGTGPTFGLNAVTSYNVGEFLTNNPLEVQTYTDRVNTGPTGIAFDKQGNVYVADYYSNTATKYDPQGTLLLVIKDQIAQCEGIAVDKSGNIYVANSTLNTVTVYDAEGELTNTIR